MSGERTQAIQRYLRAGRYDRKTFSCGVGSSVITVATATDIGGMYLDPAAFPINGKDETGPGATYTATFRGIIETNDATGGLYTAQLDLFDADGVLNAAVPVQVTGSQLTTDALIPTLVTADVSGYFFPGNDPTVWTTAGIFTARLSIQTALATKAVICKMAELHLDW